MPNKGRYGRSRGLGLDTRRTLLDQRLVAPAPAFEFLNIPSGGACLRLMAWLREDDAVGNTAARLRFNGDAGSVYDTQNSRVFQTSASPIEALARTAAVMDSCSLGDTADAGLFAMLVIDILNYDTATEEKVFTFQGQSKSATGSGTFIACTGSGWWRSKQPINRITLLPNAGNWKSRSRAVLYLA